MGEKIEMKLVEFGNFEGENTFIKKIEKFKSGKSLKLSDSDLLKMINECGIFDENLKLTNYMLQQMLISNRIHLVRGKDGERPAWHYVLVDNDKALAFQAVAKTGNIDVADYGKILQSGWGDSPPENETKIINDLVEWNPHGESLLKFKLFILKRFPSIAKNLIILKKIFSRKSNNI